MTPGERGGAAGARRPATARVGASAGAAGDADARRLLSLAGRLGARGAARAGRAAALAARPDPVAGRRLGRFRRPAPEPRAAALRRAGPGRRARHRAVRAAPLPARPPLRRLLLAAARSHRGRSGRRPTLSCWSWRTSSRRAGASRWRWRWGTRTLAEALCDRATVRWQRGTRSEQRLLAAGSVRAPIYASVVREKLSWIGVPSQALLHGARQRAPRDGVPARARSVHARAPGDRRRDRHRSRIGRFAGCDVPTALGCSPGALIRVGAEAAAERGGRRGRGRRLRLVRDLAATPSRARRAPGASTAIRVGDELDAIGIAGEIEEAVSTTSDKLVRIPPSPQRRRVHPPEPGT